MFYPYYPPVTHRCSSPLTTLTLRRITLKKLCVILRLFCDSLRWLTRVSHKGLGSAAFARRYLRYLFYFFSSGY